MSLGVGDYDPALFVRGGAGFLWQGVLFEGVAAQGLLCLERLMHWPPKGVNPASAIEDQEAAGFDTMATKGRQPSQRN